MRHDEIISQISIAVSNEEEEVMNRLYRPMPLHIFNERDQFIIENLVKKSLVSKTHKNNLVLVKANDQPTNY